MTVDEPLPWPESAFPLDAVREWIASALDLPAPVAIVPRNLYAIYTDAPDLRLTARLAVTDAEGVAREVVFKGNRFSLLAASARAHALVSRHCPGRVSHVLAAQDTGDGSSCLLYQPFEGSPVDSPTLLQETARTMACIQNAVTASGEGEAVDLVPVSASDIPSLFEAVYAHIEARESAWRTDADGSLSNALGSPAADVLAVLDSAREQIYQHAAEISALNLPNSIDHGDLHGGNAMVQADGTVLIYDWETATFGCPLFSIEKLLVAAWKLDEKATGGGPWGYRAGTPTQALVRDAYLDSLGRNEIDTYTFATAMCLATIKEMHAEIVWANNMGWQDGNPEWTAQLIRRMRYHFPNYQ